MPTYLHLKYRDLSAEQKKIADIQMDGSNFDCNKCTKIIMKTEARCLMGGRKKDMPAICFEYGAVCEECFNEANLLLA